MTSEKAEQSGTETDGYDGRTRDGLHQAYHLIEVLHD